MRKMNNKKDEFLIDATNPESFPAELNKLVTNIIDQTPKNELQKIKDCIPKHEMEINCLLESLFGVLKRYEVYQNELIPIFNQYDLLCYHATRVKTIDDIKQYGLRTDLNFYIIKMKEVLKAEGVCYKEIDLVINDIINEYQRKYDDNPHQLCFFINPISFQCSDGRAGYNQFCDTIGGELANWALEKQNNEVLSILKTRGIPIVVEFRAPFSRVVEYHKDSLIFPFVVSVAARKIWNYEYVIEADCSLIGDIPPSRICRLISPAEFNQIEIEKKHPRKRMPLTE